jgi:methionine-rich copper-binding protein CopC
VIILAGTARIEAHAFLKDAEPAVGSTVQTSPNEVRIRFTEKIEPSFSSIQSVLRSQQLQARRFW